eukprot:2154071-Pyramimonas_sp.AAC.1
MVLSSPVPGCWFQAGRFRWVAGFTGFLFRALGFPGDLIIDLTIDLTIELTIEVTFDLTIDITNRLISDLTVEITQSTSLSI